MNWIKRQYSRYKLRKELRGISTTEKAVMYLVGDHGRYLKPKDYSVRKWELMQKRKEEIKSLLNYI